MKNMKFLLTLCLSIVLVLSTYTISETISINNKTLHEGMAMSGLMEKGSISSDISAERLSERKEQKQLTVTATAYTAQCDGCSGTTYTGIDLEANPNQKVIAVDPDIIPLGSKVHVEGYGTAIAADIGSAINGHRIDVFIPSEAEANKFGVKKLEVTILS